MSTLKIVFCWTGLTGYMPACWKALQALPDVDVRVFIEKRRVVTQHAFRLDALDGVPCLVRDREDGKNVDAWIDEIEAFQPDIIEVTGWFSRLSQAVAKSPRLTRVPKILGLDLPYRGTFRQRVAPLVLWRYVRRFSAVCVSGERAADYALRLGFSERQIDRSLYGFDYREFSTAGKNRPCDPWPARFLFVGRYCRDKGIACLVEAYRLYRTRVKEPWTLSCCGLGECGSILKGVDGLTDFSFCPPERLPGLFAEHGALILPSRREPWGVVLGEACASGMPVIATSACGSSVEFVRHRYNGWLCAPDDPQALCEAMEWMHHHRSELSLIGERASRLAEPYAAEVWAANWREMALRWSGVR